MSTDKKQEIADAADMIVSGYSFTCKGENVEVVNLNMLNPHTMIMTTDARILESNMDPIEEEIVFDKWDKNKEFMEACNA